MKRWRSLKWLLALGTLAMVLSLGAVACGSDSGDQDVAGEGVRQRDRLHADAAGDECAPGERPSLMKRGQAAKDRLEAQADRREARGERLSAMLEDLREQMSTEDQALYDQLKASIEEQRDDLEAARGELADTLGQLRELADEYLDLDDKEDE